VKKSHPSVVSFVGNWCYTPFLSACYYVRANLTKVTYKINKKRRYYYIIKTHEYDKSKFIKFSLSWSESAWFWPATFQFFFKKKNSLKSPQTPKCLGLTPSLRASNK
jgi:hypothetical protein